MSALAALYCALIIGSLAYVIRRVSRLNSAPTGFTLIGRYPTTAVAAQASAFLRQHGIAAELDDRRLRQFARSDVGAVHVLVRTADVARAERALDALARSAAGGAPAT